MVLLPNICYPKICNIPLCNQNWTPSHLVWCSNDFSQLHIEILLHSAQRGWKSRGTIEECDSGVRLLGSAVKSVKRHKFKHLYCWNWKRCRDENEKLSQGWWGILGGRAVIVHRLVSDDSSNVLSSLPHCLYGSADGMTDVWPTWRALWWFWCFWWFGSVWFG